VSSVRASVVVAGVLRVPGGLGARGVDTDRMDAICRAQPSRWSGECGMRGLIVSWLSGHAASCSCRLACMVPYRCSLGASKRMSSRGSKENVKSVTPLSPHIPLRRPTSHTKVGWVAHCMTRKHTYISWVRRAFWQSDTITQANVGGYVS